MKKIIVEFLLKEYQKQVVKREKLIANEKTIVETSSKFDFEYDYIQIIGVQNWLKNKLKQLGDFDLLVKEVK